MGQIYTKYKDQGLSIFAFPSLEFGEQEFEDPEDIKAFVAGFEGTTFPLFKTIKVNGDQADPVYKYLKQTYPEDIKWNFDSTFLINRQGVPERRFLYKNSDWQEIEYYFKKALEEPAFPSKAN
eukprot:g78971.t1